MLFRSKIKKGDCQVSYWRDFFTRSSKSWASGNFNLRGGPNLRPDQMRAVSPSLSVMEISKAPFLMGSPDGFISESMFSEAKEEEASKVMHSPGKNGTMRKYLAGVYFYDLQISTATERRIFKEKVNLIASLAVQSTDYWYGSRAMAPKEGLEGLQS